MKPGSQPDDDTRSYPLRNRGASSRYFLRTLRRGTVKTATRTQLMTAVPNTMTA